MASRLKDNHPLSEFHKQQIAEKQKTKKKKKVFLASLEFLFLTIMIGGFIWIIKTVSFQ